MRYRYLLLLSVALILSCTSSQRKEQKHEFTAEPIPAIQTEVVSPKFCDITQSGQKNTVLALEKESNAPYSRKYFMNLNKGRSWGDLDHDCQDTRAEVLTERSLIPVVMSKNRCAVRLGLWHDPYTDSLFEDASDLDIDHIIPLKEAYESGAIKWDDKQRGLFANDYQISKNLIPVWNSSNRSKGAKDLAEWLPSDENYHCEYVLRWIGIKSHWKLSVDEKECLVIQKLVQQCDMDN